MIFRQAQTADLAGAGAIYNSTIPRRRVHDRQLAHGRDKLLLISRSDTASKVPVSQACWSLGSPVLCLFLSSS